MTGATVLVRWSAVMGGLWYAVLLAAIALVASCRVVVVWLAGRALGGRRA